ncbi:MAG TPA: hypothetical protein VHV10_09890, partial [Ktedonobacteraceae bacterium]|nr:hypothetical protein [Ktedonobacteraceae bacterium]
LISLGSRREDQALRPNDALYWQAIQDACADGFRWCGLGDVELGHHGLAKFKSKWGAEAKMVYDYSYPPSHNGINSAQYLSRPPAYQRLVRAAWPYLPINMIGLLSSWYHTLP